MWRIGFLWTVDLQCHLHHQPEFVKNQIIDAIPKSWKDTLVRNSDSINNKVVQDKKKANLLSEEIK